MTDFARFRTHQTLKAAGFPTDLNAIVGRQATYQRYTRETPRFSIVGIDFGISSFSLLLDAPMGIFQGRPLLYYAPYGGWESWFCFEEEPESIVRVQLL